MHIWGIPDDVYQISEDEKALIYVNQSSFTIPGTAPSYITNYIGNTAYTTTYPGRAPQTIKLIQTSYRIVLSEMPVKAKMNIQLQEFRSLFSNWFIATLIVRHVLSATGGNISNTNVSTKPREYYCIQSHSALLTDIHTRLSLR